MVVGGRVVLLPVEISLAWGSATLFLVGVLNYLLVRSGLTTTGNRCSHLAAGVLVVLIGDQFDSRLVAADVRH